MILTKAIQMYSLAILMKYFLKENKLSRVVSLKKEVIKHKMSPILLVLRIEYRFSRLLEDFFIT